MRQVGRAHFAKCLRTQTHAPNRSTARAFAFAASSSRFFGGAVVSSECKRRAEIAAISSIAARNEASLAFDGLLKPVIFLTNCSDAARISSALTGGSKLKRVLMFLHISASPPTGRCAQRYNVFSVTQVRRCLLRAGVRAQTDSGGPDPRHRESLRRRRQGGRAEYSANCFSRSSA